MRLSLQCFLLLLLSLVSVDGGCQQSISATYPFNRSVSNAEKLFDIGAMGKVVLYADDNFNNNSLVKLGDGRQGHHTQIDISKKRAMDFNLFPGTYWIDLTYPSGIFSRGGTHTLRFSVQGGKTQYIALSEQQSSLTDQPPTTQIRYAEVRYLWSEVNFLLAPPFELDFMENHEARSAQIVVKIHKAARDPKFELNGKPISGSVEKSGDFNIFSILGLMNEGDNSFLLTAKNIKNEPFSHPINIRIKSESELKSETYAKIDQMIKKEEENRLQIIRLAEAERKRKSDELIEEKRRKDEIARIAKEGDGTPDDIKCKSYGLKPQQDAYKECRMRLDLIRLESQKRQELAKGDGSPDHDTCSKYGLRVNTSEYSSCRFKLDFARQEAAKESERYERERLLYEQRLAEHQKEVERQRAMRQVELGLRLLGGQPPIQALGSVGTGAPIAPVAPRPFMQTIILPGGRSINCSTTGTITNCF